MRSFDLEKLLLGCAQETVTGVAHGLAQEVPRLVVRALTAHDAQLEAQQDAQHRQVQAQVASGSPNNPQRQQELALQERVLAMLEREQDPQAHLVLLKVLDGLVSGA